MMLRQLAIQMNRNEDGSLLHTKITEIKYLNARGKNFFKNLRKENTEGNFPNIVLGNNVLFMKT